MSAGKLLEKTAVLAERKECNIFYLSGKYSTMKNDILSGDNEYYHILPKVVASHTKYGMFNRYGTHLGTKCGWQCDTVMLCKPMSIIKARNPFMLQPAGINGGYRIKLKCAGKH